MTVVRATELKNMEMVGKSDPYVRLFVRVLFKTKTTVKDNNLNPVWNEVFEMDVEDQETQLLILQVRAFQPSVLDVCYLVILRVLNLLLVIQVQ